MATEIVLTAFEHLAAGFFLAAIGMVFFWLPFQILWMVFLKRAIKLTDQTAGSKALLARILFIPVIPFALAAIAIALWRRQIYTSLDFILLGIAGLLCGYAVASFFVSSKVAFTVIRKSIFDFFVWLTLLFAKQDTRNQFEWFVRWRFELVSLKIVRWWERTKLLRWFKMQRWIWVLLMGTTAYLLAAWFITGDWAHIPNKAYIDKLGSLNAGVWTLLTAMISAPIAFVIWWFRDTNNLWQIDNARKDTNLKDFQQLAQWASGLHLVEDKVTLMEKSKETAGSSESEKSTTTETTSAPTNQLLGLQAPPRHAGAASLQIAAIYQLHAFLRGEFGVHFQRPAFALLKSIWLSLVQAPVREHLAKWQDDWDQNQISKWRDGFSTLVDTPLAKAITLAIADEQGLAMQKHANDLPSANFACMNYHLAGVKKTPIELFQQNLDGIEWQGTKVNGGKLQGAGLTKAKLQGADLRWANLQGADLYGANLKGANLMWANLHGVVLYDANLQGAILNHANLQGADLRWANLQGAVLAEANLQDAVLNSANLQGAHFLFTNLQGANLCDSFVNNDTNFYSAVINSASYIGITNGLLDDDPHPLATHRLREIFRDKNQADLPAAFFSEYQTEWDAASSEEKTEADLMANAQTYEERWGK